MAQSLLPNTLRHFKVYCAPPTIISQPVLFLRQAIEIVPLGHVRVVVQKCDPVILSEIYIHTAGVQQFHEIIAIP